jgi:hypothetical protein
MKKIEITEHARQRLMERMPEVHSSQYTQVVQYARYKGKTEDQLKKENPAFAKALMKRFYKDNSTVIRVYRNHVFVFFGSSGHSRKLKTVVDIPKHILSLCAT